MITLITLLHVIVCVFLILVVLLQSGSKADLASAFGGASTQTAFGSRGPASFLHKLTVGCAIIFMITCLSLTIYSTRMEEKTAVRDKPGTVSKSTSQKPAVPSSTKQDAKSNAPVDNKGSKESPKDKKDNPKK